MCSQMKDLITISQPLKVEVATATNVDSKIVSEETDKGKCLILQYTYCQICSMSPDLKKKYHLFEYLENCQYSAEDGC